MLLTNYLKHCAREPGTPTLEPPKMTVLHHTVDYLKQHYWSFFSSY
uniref:Uncharacterized protein n=1 Tax=Loxodonta africana TaxID=9785 RepID=G3U726_LOXAF